MTQCVNLSLRTGEPLERRLQFYLQMQYLLDWYYRLLAESPASPLPFERPASIAAESPMDDYTARAVVLVLFVGILVVALVGGGLLILNLGLLSKRREDHTGHRTPSDVGILKSSNWPEEIGPRYVLPIDEEELAEREEQEALRNDEFEKRAIGESAPRKRIH